MKVSWVFLMARGWTYVFGIIFISGGFLIQAQSPAPVLQPGFLHDHYLFNQTWQYDAQDYSSLPWTFYYANVSTEPTPGTRRGRCALTQVNGMPYGHANFDWFDYQDYSPADGEFPYAPPGEYLAGQTGAGKLTGFDFDAEFGGAPTSPTTAGFFVEAVYFTDRECSDGGAEYGWYRLPASSTGDQPLDSVTFYYSVFTNCNGDFMCWDTNGMQVFQNTTTVTLTTIPCNSRSTVGPNCVASYQPGWLEYDFKAIRRDSWFTITLLDPVTKTVPAGCSASISPSTLWIGQRGTRCELSIPIASWYPSPLTTESGYIVAAAQSSRTHPPPAGLPGTGAPPPDNFPALGALTVHGANGWYR
jgi:hypothetical protein